MFVITYQYAYSTQNHQVRCVTAEDAHLTVRELLKAGDVKRVLVENWNERRASKVPKIVEDAYPDVHTMSRDELIKALCDELADVRQLEEAGKVYAVITNGAIRHARTPINEVLEAIDAT